MTSTVSGERAMGLRDLGVLGWPSTNPYPAILCRVLTTLNEDFDRSTESHFNPQISERLIPVNVANRYSVPNLQAFVASRNLRIVSTSHILVWFRTALGGVTELNLAGQAIEYLPPEIGGLSDLVLLDLDGNSFPNVPVEIGGLKWQR